MPSNTPSAGQLFTWQDLFVFGAVTCQEVTGSWEKGAWFDDSSWSEPFPRGLGDKGGGSQLSFCEVGRHL